VTQEPGSLIHGSQRLNPPGNGLRQGVVVSLSHLYAHADRVRKARSEVRLILSPKARFVKLMVHRRIKPSNTGPVWMSVLTEQIIGPGYPGAGEPLLKVVDKSQDIDCVW